MKILVTGGAGYVGSVVAEELLKKDYQVLVLDNLQQGHKQAVPEGAEFVFANICDDDRLNEVFHHYSLNAVMHLAAESTVDYSVTDPGRYFWNNVAGGLHLLEIMRRHQVDKLIFSSSAAVYGEPRTIPIEESHPGIPVNAYGESKLMFERILDWYGRAYGLKYISLRYFNAAGASKLLGEDHRPETHLIPNVLKVALRTSDLGLGLRYQSPTPLPRYTGIKEPGIVSIFGNNYPTKDGSCIRDYIHVMDIAHAHILALKSLQSSVHRSQHAVTNTYNLGNGEGYSVLEVIETAKKITGINIPIKICARRPGDPAVLVASANLAKTELGWKPQFPKLETILESAWMWMKEHPEGYAE